MPPLSIRSYHFLSPPLSSSLISSPPLPSSSSSSSSSAPPLSRRFCSVLCAAAPSILSERNFRSPSDATSKAWGVGKRWAQTRRALSYLPPDGENSNGRFSALKSSTRPVEAVPHSGTVQSSGSSGRVLLDPFRGKSGSVSFCGMTYEMLERRKLVSSPFEDGKGSFLWVFGPLSLIASLVLPQFFLGNAIQSYLQDEILAEIIASLSSEAMFYVGLAAFFFVVDRVQRPYLEFSPKRWSLITGLRGYLSSTFFTMGLKVIVPLLAAYVVWPIVGLPAVIAVAPFLLGCAAQFAFEMHLQKHNSSCWPVLPIIFEVYRLYQLNKGAHFLEKLLFSMKDSSANPALMEMSSALVAMLAIFQILGIVCLWSLATFLLRLFPSRPVAENY